MELKKSMKKKTENLVRRNLKGELTYYLEMAPFVPPLADYYEAAGKEGLSWHDRDALRMNAYRTVLPELKACFAGMVKDWDARLAGEQWQHDLGVDRINAVKVAALILFLTDI
jgi:hypothetical protein